jgi:hypothetical protein
MCRLPNHKLIEVAARAGTQPQTVRKYLLGKIRRESIIESIEKALNDLSLSGNTQVRSSLARSSLPKNQA